MAKRHWLIVVLALSLSANLLVAGALAGRWYHGLRDQPPPLAWAIRDMDEATRESLRPILRRHVREVRSSRRALRAASSKVRTAIEAEPFNPEVLAAALEGVRATSSAYQEQVHSLAVEALADLPLELRRMAAGRLLRPEGSGGPPGKHRGSGPPPGPPPGMMGPPGGPRPPGHRPGGEGGKGPENGPR